MGKLTIEGKASKEYAYDLMEISMIFYARETVVAQAVKKVMEQAEKFLEKLDKVGIHPESLQIGDDSISRDSYSGKEVVRAERELKLKIPFDMDFANYIRYLIGELRVNVNLQVQYSFLNPEKIHKELIQLALEDSKAKAQCVAQMMEQKVVGIDSVSIGEEWRRKGSLPNHPLTGLREDCYQELPGMLSNRVQAPTSREDESVEVVWLIE